MSPDGSFTVGEVVPPYHYSLVTPSSTNWYVQSATQAGTDVRRGVVQTGPGAPNVDIMVSPRGASLAATVQWPETGTRSPARLTILQPNGSDMLVVAETTVRPPVAPATDRPALISGLAPGEYVVYAWTEPVTVEYGRADALGNYSNLSQTVTVEEGAQGHASVKVAGLP